MKRFFALSLLFWTVLLAPGLCAAGVVLHPCECGSADACSHEGCCLSDPCVDPVPIPQSLFLQGLTLCPCWTGLFFQGLLFSPRVADPLIDPPLTSNAPEISPLRI
jgi:hypothetical protein